MTKRFARQGFLGEMSESVISSARVALVGYGGGGSHIGIQLAHIGFRDVTVVDPDIVEESNLNRLIGAVAHDAASQTPKVDVARRVIKGVNPEAHPTACQAPWEQELERLRATDILIGCVDSFAQRAAIERFARRFLIPYVDIGMDVRAREGDFQIIGQVVLSSPGNPCLRCLGIIDDQLLQNEERARQYGEAGSRPQVVWPNGVLASTAVGLVVQLLTPWTHSRAVEYLEYDGNEGTLRRAPRLRTILASSMECSHYADRDVGDPLFVVRSPRD